MEFLQLKYFYESAQNENFAKTAEKYMVPSSSVSASVKRLENELGVELFDRYSNKIKLNEKGHRFYEAIGEIFEKMESVVAEITEKRVESPEISILIKARRRWITDLIIAYNKKHPEIHFRVSNDFYITDFSRFDIIVDEQSENYSDWERFFLREEQICIKASANSPLVGKKLKFYQLREQPFIMTRKNSGVRKLLESAGRRNGFTPDIAVECNDIQCLKQYVEADMGLTLGSKTALKTDSEKNIVSLDVEDFNEIQLVYVYHRKLKASDIALKNFCEFLSKNSQIYNK